MDNKIGRVSEAPPGKSTTSTADRRRQYRISSGLDGTLTVALILADGAEHPAELVDVSAGGACLRWPPGKIVVLNVGQQVRLWMQSSIAGAPITLSATVRWIGTDDERNVRYGVEFHDLDEMFADLSPGLRWLFNRRRVER